MIYVLYGPNAYARAQKAQELSAAARSRAVSLLERRFFLDEEGMCEEAFDAMASASLFAGEKKLIRLSGCADAVDHPLMNHLIRAAASSDTVCIMSEAWPRKDIPKKILALFGDHAYKSQFFPQYTDGQCVERALTDARAEGIGLQPDGARFLASAYENDLYAMMSDARMWSLMTDCIDASFLARQALYTHAHSFFAGASALGPRSSLASRLEAWERILSGSSDRYGLFYYLAKATSDGEFIARLARVDVEIKSGRLDMDTALFKALLVE